MEQLKTYLSIKQQKTGYLLSFCDNVKSPREDKKFEMDGYTIYETIVAVSYTHLDVYKRQAQR